MLQSTSQQPSGHHYKPGQQAPSVVFQVPVFENPETPAYTCCVPKPFLSLVAGNTVQEVQGAVKECVADFIAICNAGGHSIPCTPTAPSTESLRKQDSC